VDIQISSREKQAQQKLSILTARKIPAVLSLHAWLLHR
jgi:hypothetical protein